VRLLPIHFRPTFDKWRDQVCRGVSLHVTDADQFRPLRTSIALLHDISRQWSSDFWWLDPPYEYETEKPPIDIIYGSAKLRETLDTSGAIDALCKIDVEDWSQRTEDFQIYQRDGRFQ